MKTSLSVSKLFTGLKGVVYINIDLYSMYLRKNIDGVGKFSVEGRSFSTKNILYLVRFWEVDLAKIYLAHFYSNF